MFDMINTTRFKAGSSALFDTEGHDLVVTAVKGTFVIPEKGKTPSLHEDQVDIFSGDQYEGDPSHSGIRYPADLVMGKINTDIGLHGTVYNPKHEPVKKLKAAVKVGEYYKEILAFGNRTWTKSLFKPGYSITEPDQFSRIPLSSERMFGGIARTKKRENIVFEDNPMGTGFIGNGDQVGGTRLPNFEDPNDRIKTCTKTHAPATFGFALPTSGRRRAWAGTFDDFWMKNRCPLFPRDMDLRYFNCAQPELTASGFLTGGENVILLNLTPGGLKAFTVPEYNIRVTFNLNGKLIQKKACIHTLVIEPDLNRFYMTWFASERLGKSRHLMEWIEIDIDSQ